MAGHAGGHKGKIKAITGSSITMCHDDGSPDDTHSVASGATITLNGQAVTLADLAVNDCVEISGDPATSVKATR